MSKDTFTVADKYKGRYEELGKDQGFLSNSFLSLLSLSLTFSYIPHLL